MSRERLPNRRACERLPFRHDGIRYLLTVGHFADGRIAEIFIDPEKPNATLAKHANDAADNR